MNLQSYVACGDLTSLDPGEVTGLVPYLIGRQPAAELVGIGLRHGRPRALRTTGLQAILDNRATGDDLALWWRSTGTDALWLIAYASTIGDGFEALSRVTEAIATCDITGETRLLLVTPEGSHWSYFEDRILERDPTGLSAVWRPPTALGKLGALAFHAASVAAREGDALTPPAEAEQRREAAQAQQIAMDLFRLSGGGAVPPGDERPQLDRAMRFGTQTVAEAVFLGVALAKDPGFCDVAVHAILTAETAPETHLRLWCEIARHTTGAPRTVAAALAALAAWRSDDPLAAEAVRAAWAANTIDLPIVEAVAAIIATGIPAAYLDGINTFDEAVPSGADTAESTRRGEVA